MRITVLLALLIVAAQANAQAPLKPGDRLIIDRADTSVVLSVRADGSVVLPSIGIVSLAGLTPAAAEDSVLRTYASIIARPDVRVTALRRIAVSGEVPRGDIFFVDATYGLAEVLAMAGGVGPEGNRKRVELWRDGARLGQFDARSGAGLAVPLHSGDLILVARAGWWSRNPFVIVSLLSSAVSLIIALSA